MDVAGDAEILPQPGAHGFAGPKMLARHRMHGPFELPPGEEGLSFALKQSLGTELKSGHRAELIENGRVFDVLVEEIRRAQSSVHVIIYIWRPCAASDRIVEALTERARAGVKVRIVVDPVGSEEIIGKRDFDRFVEPRLTEAGCEVHYFRLLSGRVLGYLLGRDHQKIVIVDGRVGVTGGFGIWEKWEGDGLSPDHWRDSHVRVEGPAVSAMQLAFSRAWQESGGELLPRDAFPEPTDCGPVRASFVTSWGATGMTDAERLARLIFASARKRLWIANAYFTPPKAMLEQLVVKREQGVDVRVLAPGPVHDVPLIRASQRSLYKRLLQKGIRIFEYGPSMMHAKTMLVDDWLSVVGSTNLDALSLTRLGEGSLVIADRAFAAEMEQSYLRDLTVSNEVHLGEYRRLRPLQRLARRTTQLLGRDV